MRNQSRSIGEPALIPSYESGHCCHATISAEDLLWRMDLRISGVCSGSRPE
jgi:hypothetical protein